MSYSISERHFKYTLYVIFFIVFIIVINRSIVEFPDSEGYLTMSIIRSPIYPIFLASLKTIFSNNFYLATIIFQTFFCLFSINFLIKNIHSTMQISSFWYILLTIILLVPCVYNHNIVNRFLSEALAYPLYLLVVSYYILSFFKENIRYLLYAFPLLFLLILTRSQFFFLIPIAIFILLWINFKKKSFKKYIWLYILFFVFPILTSTIDKLYHGIKHNYFVNTPWTGLHLITPAFYVADKEDVSIYKSEKEKHFFNAIFDILERKKLNINYLDSSVYDETEYYLTNFTQIANHTIYDDGKDLLGNNLSENEKFIKLDEITKKMAFPLIIDNFTLWLKLYIKNFINAFENSRYALLYFIILFFGLFQLKRMSTNKVKFIIIGSLFTILNVAIVAIGMETIKRFTFYNDWIFFLIIFVFLDTFIENKKTI